MPPVTLPNNLTNGQPNDAAQVMADFNAILAVLNGAIDASNVATALMNTFLKLATGADVKIKFGSGGSSNMNSAAGRSRAAGSFAHGLGRDPIVAFLFGEPIAITEDADTRAISFGCTHDAANISWVATVPGTSNNGFNIFYVVIG